MGDPLTRHSLVVEMNAVVSLVLSMMGAVVGYWRFVDRSHQKESCLVFFVGCILAIELRVLDSVVVTMRGVVFRGRLERH